MKELENMEKYIKIDAMKNEMFATISV